jgi:putative addiction module component (TIGR02574 family)
MNRTIEEIASELLALPARSRLLLAEQLVESVDGYADPETAEAWTREIARRIEDYEAGLVAGVPSEDVLREAREKLREAGQVSPTRTE